MTDGLSASSLLQFLTQALYFGVFIEVGVSALRRPRRATTDTALFFGAAALIIGWQWISNAADIQPSPVFSILTSGLLMALPYLLLRLVDDFAGVPVWLLRLAEVGLALSVLGLTANALMPEGWPGRGFVIVGAVLYFAVLELYCAARFIRLARRTRGVTARRMQAVALGSGLLGLVILLVLPGRIVPDLAWLWTVFSRTAGLGSGIAYALGFAPPGLVRRAWQEPELRAFLGRAASLPRLPYTEAIVRELQRGAAEATGASASTVGLWDADRKVLSYAPEEQGQAWYEATPEQFLAGHAFRDQRALFSDNAAKDDPGGTEVYERSGAFAVLAAPITAGQQRLGVLVVYSARSPIFAEDDLELVQLLADQAAVILESRALIDEAARVRAREEATRLRDDFLSSAAHDLKTPLTTMLAQSQLLERRALRNPEAPADLPGIRRIVGETRRLNGLVLELLDASRADVGRLTGPRDLVDVVEVTRSVCARYSNARHPCAVDAVGSVAGIFDPVRIEQLLNNLIENAVKYSPDGGAVRVTVQQTGQSISLSVADSGIGIPPDEVGNVFERFHRARNVDDRSFAGMGLGLYICRAIVEEHGGRIEATSVVGRGTTFHVTLPLEAPVLAPERVSAELAHAS